MCGFCVIIRSESPGRSSDEIRERATRVIAHRGPDDESVLQIGRVFLGFRRLAIIDVTDRGRQPMEESSGRYAIVFNGEIYNFHLLKEELVAKGYSFRSESDTEVLLHGYHEWGSGIVRRLHGMFAFVIHDKNSGELFFARDRMGKKPLLMYRDRSSFALFSELKQAHAMADGKLSVDPQGLLWYLVYGSVPGPRTIFREVSAVPPGSFGTWGKHGLELQTYWELPDAGTSSLLYEDAKTQVRSCVEDAVRMRLISDVPLGAFLSGGVDSSIIVGLMQKLGAEPIRTFSVRYEQAPQSYNEDHYAALVSQKFSTQHHTVSVGPSDVLSSLDDIIWKMDQPSCDAINTYFVSRAARQGVTVALSGVGADELFAGYGTFKFSSLLSSFRTGLPGVPRKRRNGIQRLFMRLPTGAQTSWPLRLTAGVLGGFRYSFERYALGKLIYSPAALEELVDASFLSDAFPLAEDPTASAFSKDRGDEIDMMSRADLQNYLRNTLLRDTDVMGMAHSVEIRAPFVDHRLIELVIGLPSHYKIRGQRTKLILKDAFSDLLPHEVLERKKMGFAFPLAVWLKHGELRSVVEECLSERSVKGRGWLSPTMVRRVKDEYFSMASEKVSSYQAYQRVWELVVLELWARKYLDGRRP